MSYPYDSRYKKDYIENMIISLIAKGRSRSEAEMEAEEWWEETEEGDEDEN